MFLRRFESNKRWGEEMADKETNDRGGCAENDAQLLKQELVELHTEKVAFIVQHKQCT
ncbi:unnamed protein product [Rhodiola kirilowii]